MYQQMKDGTLKQINPYTNVEVWCVLERGRQKSILTAPPVHPKALEQHQPEDYCFFCERHLLHSPPEKSRIVHTETGWKHLPQVPTTELHITTPAFRRVGNLFEIVGFQYWHDNYGYTMTHADAAWMESYLSSIEGYEHCVQMLRYKLTSMDLDLDAMREDELLLRFRAFFAGCHDLLIGHRHYKEGAQFQHELCSSGALSPDEHEQYLLLAVHTLRDMVEKNPFIRHVSVFQNWLAPSGASFDHLHKQLVGLDEWGQYARSLIHKLEHNRNFFNEFGLNFAIYNGHVIAENDYAVMMVQTGEKDPTVVIFCKSVRWRPTDVFTDELRGMSDLVHAGHAALGETTPCNEEWYYAPFDSVMPEPWRILLRVRVNTVAGFEGNTEIYISPFHPNYTREILVDALLLARKEGRIAPKIRIGTEVTCRPNALEYFRSRS